MKRAFRLTIGLMLLFSATSASAQLNPFKSSRSETRLSATDLELMGNSVRRLNETPQLAVGAKEPWSNPATGSHGTSTVSRIFTIGKMPCHALHHEFLAQDRDPARSYDATWCRTSNGQWKIRS